MKKRYVALGFYHEPSTALAVQAKLRAQHFWRFATITCNRDQSITVHNNIPFGVDSEIIDTYKRMVLIDEILILVVINQSDVRDVLALLRKVPGGHPVTFLLRPALFDEGDMQIAAEPVTLHELQEEATKLASTLTDVNKSNESNYSLIKSFDKSNKTLHLLHKDITDAEYIEQTIPSSAEWLLDNMYVLEGSIEDVKLNLPKKYCKSLPSLKKGPYAGYPRIYVLAIEFIKNCAGKVTKEAIVAFLESYQVNHPLTSGELWAFPLMLRFRLVEWIEFLAIRIDSCMREGELAAFWGNRLLSAARHDQDRLPDFFMDLTDEKIPLSGHFLQELLDHLFDEETILPLVREWAEAMHGIPVAELLHEQHIEESQEVVVFSNCIKSLITLSQLSWSHIFEQVSPVHALLQNDPDGIYAQMDFKTRNSYREAIEKIAKRIYLPEEQVAKAALELASLGKMPYDRHVGYYLLDDGRAALEKKLNYKPRIVERLETGVKRRATLFYLGSIGAFTFALEYLGYRFLTHHGVLGGELLILLALLLFAFSEISIQCINMLLSLVLPVRLRPQMSFEKGIPERYKTLVVIPTMLVSEESIQRDLERLEIRYLANNDPQVYFSLFSDYVDASQESSDFDHRLLILAIEGMRELEKKYGPGRFFLFHRKRIYSPCENCWMGWERKRGKLEFLNKYLLHEPLGENILYMGNPEALKGMQFVLTLDADTQLPRDQARMLIEVLAHPLNYPYVNSAHSGVDRGYTIIQPKVTTDFLHSKASRYSQIFSEPAFVDPYTKAISNTYQDLFNSSSYHGKGLYHLESFHKILSDRFPDNLILSHDLLEGNYARVGFASNIDLYDIFPKDYLTYATRQHRWMRGDWQIIDWLFPKVPTKHSGWQANTLAAIDRWKIFDNVRRIVLPIAILSLLVMGWMIPSIALYCTLLSILVPLIPCIQLCINTLFTYSFSALKSSLIDLKVLLCRSIITISLLPFDAFNSLDAFVRVFYRRLISHKHLLQWTVCEEGQSNGSSKHTIFMRELAAVSLFGLVVLACSFLLDPFAWYLSLPICLLWALSPLIVSYIDQPVDLTTKDKLSDEDTKFLRKVARKTWRYFDELVGSKTHWMPPDNYQTVLNVEIAERTSPTNIGFWLLALVSAYDCKYISCDELIDKAINTIHELDKLERHEGHFLNWYNITTRDPLYPRYVSTVDSGNLLASFWTLRISILESISLPLISHDTFSGFEDLLQLAKDDGVSNTHIHIPTTTELASLISTIKAINAAHKQEVPLTTEALSYWQKKIGSELDAFESIFSRYFSWVEPLTAISDEDLKKIDPQGPSWRQEALFWQPSLEDFANAHFIEALNRLVALGLIKQNEPHIVGWAKTMQKALSLSQWLAGEKLGLVYELVEAIERYTEEMNLAFLYNEERKLFAIGYNVDDKRLDSSYYDLLASEARLASLVGIAKEDVPLEHWWALGRLYSVVDGRKVLLSWGGTMFEYLMPLLFNKYHGDSLLGEACVAAVRCQIDYGKKRGIPWGISESAFSAIDVHKIYQYKSFGIPGLGLKRGLENDLVISPYSTVLALSVDPKEALSNMHRLAKQGHSNMLGVYGYFESIDYMRQVSPKGERGIIVYTYMAHHQGMIFTSINNTLNADVLIRRFHQDRRISGLSALLYERIPSSTPLKIQGIRDEPVHRRLEPFSQSPILGVTNTPESVTPKITLLSNGSYSLMITNSGGGYSRWKDIDVYRWRADTTADSWGSFCYVKNISNNQVWSTAYQPTQTIGKGYYVNFKPDKAEFKRRDDEIETQTEIIVTPDDNAEVRMLTLINHATTIQEIELTSYLELVLAPHVADRSHPSFNKMFIETEGAIESSAIMAFRRHRSEDEKPLFAIHVVASSAQFEGDIEFETDRAKFIGRGHSLTNPIGLHQKLSGSVGAVLDPIFSLRRRVKIMPGQRVVVSFVTAVADNKETALSLIEKYKDIAASHRASELAWTYAELELRYLRIEQEESQLFQKLASRIIYPQIQLRAVEERVRKNRLGQSSLWQYGISGDWPMVVITVGDIYDIGLVKQLLQAHSFLSLRGLKFDLIILNEEEAGYFQPLNEQLQSLINAYGYRNKPDEPGGVFLRTASILPEDDLNLILSLANVVLVASRGSLRQQLVSPKPRWQLPKKFTAKEGAEDFQSAPLPFMEMQYYNGLGGYIEEGKSYVIYLADGLQTPQPWINVLANPNFGTIVTEAGMGCTWYKNSQTNRLTPWSNDAVSNPIVDTIYLRDEELGTFWTVACQPICEKEPYRISHSQGFSRFEHNSHGINQELVTFVPVDDGGGLPLRIQRLKVTNTTSKKRLLSATSYTELVLGTDKEVTQMNVYTEWDPEHQVMFAYNRYNKDFGSCVAFTYASKTVSSFTGDRTEFLGRNSSTKSPAALFRKALSGHVGALLDPCASLQVHLELEPGETGEVVFVLGYATSHEEALSMVTSKRSTDEIEKLFAETRGWWDKTLETIQIDVPDRATNYFVNRWLLYQSLACRFWGRSAFYQSSGAYGFRDQLQDTMAIVYSHPHIARDYILKAASRQYVEGDVQHWWHPETGAGVRTRCSDDLLWLPFVTAHYVRITGDRTILDEKVPFLEAEVLAEGQDEVFGVPTKSAESATLLEHCRRAVKKGVTHGPHGLPLIGSGDWNDGMNRVGIEGKGESVWLAWFIIHVLHDFAELIAPESGEGLKSEAKRLADVVENSAWDGSWYRRAYFDDGTAIGSSKNREASIDSIAQSWAVLSGLADPVRASTALESAYQRLVKDSLVLLLTPPFDKTTHDPGYIKGYPPGVRENGGQYTHGSSWLAMGFARFGNGARAAELLSLLCPTAHTGTLEQAKVYRVEPYVVAADIYHLQDHIGRGGWTWYTGSSAWIYRIWLEEVLGFTLRGNLLSFSGALPNTWESCSIKYKYKSSLYKITIKITSGEQKITLDGTSLSSREIPLQDDGKEHLVEITFMPAEE